MPWQWHREPHCPPRIYVCARPSALNSKIEFRAPRADCSGPLDRLPLRAHDGHCAVAWTDRRFKLFFFVVGVVSGVLGARGARGLTENLSGFGFIAGWCKVSRVLCGIVTFWLVVVIEMYKKKSIVIFWHLAINCIKTIYGFITKVIKCLLIFL